MKDRSVVLTEDEAIFVSKMLFMLLSLHALKPFLLVDELRDMELLGLKFIDSFNPKGGGILN